MKLKIRESKPEEKEEVLELWLEPVSGSLGSIGVKSCKNGRIMYEFSIYPDGTWVKVVDGHLNNRPK